MSVYVYRGHEIVRSCGLGFSKTEWVRGDKGLVKGETYTIRPVGRKIYCAESELGASYALTEQQALEDAIANIDSLLEEGV